MKQYMEQDMEQDMAGRGEVSAMPGYDYPQGYREDEEMYVYDQSCDNCRFYCDWDDEENNGCRNYGRPDYEKYPRSHWCCDWKGRRRGGCR